MKASELRIGNIVNEFGLPIVATPELIAKLHDIEKRGKIAIDISPIPLTEEWLVRLGFEMYEGNNFYRYWIIGGDYVKGFELTFRPALDGILFCYTPRQTDSRNEIHIKHVHQLQNLYFTLTGDELKLNNQEVT